MHIFLVSSLISNRYVFAFYTQENVAIVEFGARTQILHSLSNNYPSLKLKIRKFHSFLRLKFYRLAMNSTRSSVLMKLYMG